MKKYLLFLALLGLLSTAYAADFGISVNSPYVATQWDCGKDLNIQWTKWGDWSKLNLDLGNQKVQILLRKNAPPRVRVVPLLIADNVPATGVNGKHLWRISGVDNGEYHVIVRTMNNLHKGVSDVFTIRSCLTLADKEPHVMARTLEHAALSIGRIAGRVSASTQGNLIAGRKVRVLLKKAGATVTSAEYALDAQGGADYQFTHLLMGTYEVSVEKVASPPPADPSSMLNVCYKGTTPALRTAGIASGSTDVTGQDFAILFDIAFNMNGVCW